MKIAVIGSGISGLTCAYLLNKKHDVHLFEQQSRLGGHTATVDIEHLGKKLAIDSGFSVFNNQAYPNFIKLINELGIKTQITKTGFSVHCAETGLEYADSNLASLFTQKRNLLNPQHLRMLADAARFKKEAILHLKQGQISEAMTLGEYLTKFGYSKRFASHYLAPRASAFWLASAQQMMSFPLQFVVQCFQDHGLFSDNSPRRWYSIKGGSNTYIEPLTTGLDVHLNADVSHIRRQDSGVWLFFADGSEEHFHQVVLATHSNQALKLLEDASTGERDILCAMPYQNNSVVLHTDERLLPSRKQAWSSWNYHLRDQGQAAATMTYNMNIVHGIEADWAYCVTVNGNDLIDPSKVFGRYTYAHPQFSRAFIAAQRRWPDINGVNHTWFCGAYWGDGMHEAGCSSGVRVAQALNIDW